VARIHSFRRLSFPAVAVLSALTAGASPALAHPPSEAGREERSPAAKTAATTGAAKPVETVAPPNVSLSIEAPTTHGAWKMVVTNDSDVPVTIVADARLLSLEVTPRGAHKAERCELPQDMRPQDDLGRSLVVPPKRSYAESFQPRLYCLEKSRLDALAAGSIVVATLGFGGRSARPPFEVSPVEGMEQRVGPLKAITSPPVSLPDEPTAAPAREGTGVLAGAGGSFVLQTPRSVDAASASEITIPVTLTNTGHRATVVRFRPEMIAFDVLGPRGADHCAWPALPTAANRDLFTTLAAGTPIGLSLVLTAYCPARVLEQSGLYVVRASFDTRKASGAEIGIRSFDGQVIATSPTVVRLHRGLHAQPFVRPLLQPL
jgi:hypothetical protein